MLKTEAPEKNDRFDFTQVFELLSNQTSYKFSFEKSPDWEKILATHIVNRGYTAEYLRNSYTH